MRKAEILNLLRYHKIGKLINKTPMTKYDSLLNFIIDGRVVLLDYPYLYGIIPISTVYDTTIEHLMENNNGIMYLYEVGDNYFRYIIN